ncbi:hypothetical protein PC39_08839 [Salinisphaera sp. PC39]
MDIADLTGAVVPGGLRNHVISTGGAGFRIARTARLIMAAVEKRRVLDIDSSGGVTRSDVLYEIGLLFIFSDAIANQYDVGRFFAPLHKVSFAIMVKLARTTTRID